MDVASRTQSLLARSRDEVTNEIRAIAADHSARGLLGSGATAKRAIASFKDRSSAALDQVLNEVARLINHRGLKWKRAMSAIANALESHIQSAAAVLEPAFRLAGCNQGDGRREADERVAAVAVHLRAQLKDFDEGWTSPEPKGWQERHPILYAIGLIIIGVAIGQVDKISLPNLLG